MATGKIEEYLKPLYQSLVNAVTWMDNNGFNNPDSRDLIGFKPGYISKNRIAYRDQDIPLSPDEQLIYDLTEKDYKVNFIKISTRISDKLVNSYNYTAEEISSPLLVRRGKYRSKVPISSGSAMSSIFYPNSYEEIPLNNVTYDKTLWDLTGDTVIVSRFDIGKYTCDKLDEDNIGDITSSRYILPMQYNEDVGPALPNTNNILSIDEDFIKVMSLFIFEQRGEYETSDIFSEKYDQVFKGIYVTPLIMLYYQIVDYRDRSALLQ